MRVRARTWAGEAMGSSSSLVRVLGVLGLLVALQGGACGEDRDPPRGGGSGDAGVDLDAGVDADPGDTDPGNPDAEDDAVDDAGEADVVDDAQVDGGGSDADADLLPECVEDADCGRSGVCGQGGVCLTRLRVATWNLEGIGEEGSEQFEATLAVIRRLGAEVMLVQEVNGEADVAAFARLAILAGYPHTALTPEGTFGPQRNGVLSALALEAVQVHTAESLSGTPGANDITRPLLTARVRPAGAEPLTLAVHHAKSGASNLDEFRQVCEAIRLTQALSGFDAGRDAYVLVGDFNEEINTGTRSPEVFTAPPEGLLEGFVLGPDLEEIMARGEMINNPFIYLQRRGGLEMVALDATQVGGAVGTRPESGRRIDYILVSPALAARGPAAEVYYAANEALGGGLSKRPPALAAGVSEVASDHLPVFADLLLSRR